MQSPESNTLSLLTSSDTTTSNTNSFKPRKRPKSLIINFEKADKKKSGCNRLEKFLILVISLMLIFCVVLLCLYLKEREINAQLSTEAQKTSNNKTTQDSKKDLSRARICWTKECIQTASGQHKFLICTIHCFFRIRPTYVLLNICTTCLITTLCFDVFCDGTGWSHTILIA